MVYWRSIKISIPFSHAIVDEMGDVVRKFRWSAKEAKWHKDQGKNVVKLDKPIEVKEDLFKLVGECLF
jgi:hypothetical protein